MLQKHIYFEMEKHKPQFHEELYKLLDEREQGNLQWLQNITRLEIILKMQSIK
jgi:hypothetical protein